MLRVLEELDEEPGGSDITEMGEGRRRRFSFPVIVISSELNDSTDIFMLCEGRQQR